MKLDDETKLQLKRLIPEVGRKNLVCKYITWSGTSFFGVFVGKQLDNIAGGSYYVEAINEAISPKFWNLVGVMGLFFCCISIPIFFLVNEFPTITVKFPMVSSLDKLLRYVTHTFCLVAFDIGALAIGILTAQFLEIINGAYMVVWQALLFGFLGVYLLFVLFLLNTILWVLGESIYNQHTKRYSGMFGVILELPVKYSVSIYFLCTGIIIYLISIQL